MPAPSRLSLEQWKKVLKGALIAGAGPALIYGLEAINAYDFGEADLVVAAAVSTLVNFVRKVFQPPK